MFRALAELNQAATFLQSSPWNVAFFGGIDDGLRARAERIAVHHILQARDFRRHIKRAAGVGRQQQLACAAQTFLHHDFIEITRDHLVQTFDARLTRLAKTQRMAGLCL